MSEVECNKFKTICNSFSVGCLFISLGCIWDSWSFYSFFFFKLFFIFGCVRAWVLHVGSSLWCTGFSLVVARAPGHVGSVVCGTQALGEAHELSSCGARA